MKITAEHIKKIIETGKIYDAKKLILFGSSIDNPNNINDIDIAADISGWKIFGFAARLEEDLGIAIDIVPLNPKNLFTQAIERRGKIIYEIV